MRKSLLNDSYHRRLRLSSREVAAALVVTIAAIVFLFVAVSGQQADKGPRQQVGARTDGTHNILK